MHLLISISFYNFVGVYDERELHIHVYANASLRCIIPFLYFQLQAGCGI